MSREAQDGSIVPISQWRKHTSHTYSQCGIASYPDDVYETKLHLNTRWNHILTWGCIKWENTLAFKKGAAMIQLTQTLSSTFKTLSIMLLSSEEESNVNLRLYPYKAVKSAFRWSVATAWPSLWGMVIFVRNGYHQSVVICISNYTRLCFTYLEAGEYTS